MTVVAEPVNTPGAWSERAKLPEPWAACGWSQRGQEDRLALVAGILGARDGDSLLDWGCGCGELVRYLNAAVKYVGFDWADGMIRRARVDHPGPQISFQVFEPTSIDFDLIACVGPFNLPDNWSKDRTWQTARRLWDGCRRTMAVSLYAGDDDRCLIYTEDEVSKQLGGLSWQSSVVRWRPNDLLAVVRR